MKRVVILAVALFVVVMTSAAQERHHRSDSRPERHTEAGVMVENSHSDQQSKWNGAHIAFDRTKHDLGVVKRKGGDLHVRFEYVNDGTEPLVITRIATSCTCIRADYRRRPLDVGESAVIELVYEPHKMEAGMFNKVVQVYSNSVDGMHLLTVSGNSVEKQ